LLTLAPNSWTHEQTSDFFGVSKYSATQAADLKLRIGILAQSPKKRNGHCSSDGKNLVTSNQIDFENYCVNIRYRGKGANYRFLYFR
jgi:hypothetical protein